MSNKQSVSIENKQNNIVEFKNAVIRHQENIILKDVNLEVKKGEFIYLIGKVGSGKSSLLKTMYAEVPVSEGYVFTVGYNLKKLKSKEIPYLRRKMGIIFQDFQLLSDRSVYENLNFVLKATGWKNKKEMDVRIRDVLTQVDMVHKGYKMPHQLSGGEQQRIGIARALLNEPELILADEPTGNLDPETTNDLMLLLFKISEMGKTVIMATHNYGMIDKYKARIIRCEDSHLKEDEAE
ncbi:cell division ATP-binding protein FtsE [Labilibacter marinus]|uniref:cell division ATP-binding protein FtsE n=1 Tax=Labilibacter marinus TaxID=1477105 RepID=UPI0009F8DADA|nr:ATP-binding cassette domain-containing protein [Labilibacter marinus]